MTDEESNKYLTVRRLIEILATLPEDYRITPNAVGNLLVASGTEYVGFIDFLDQGSMQWV